MGRLQAFFALCAEYRRQSRHNVGDNEPDRLESLDGSEPYLSEMTRRVLRMSEGYPDNDLPTDAVAARHHAARDGVVFPSFHSGTNTR